MSQISIILPVFNQDKYIEQCINSLKSQTFTDFEAIFVNDGSTDRTQEILEQCIKDDDRFLIIKKQNAGVSAARNTGLQAANGEWICFVDPDDYVEGDYLRILIEAAEKHPKADIVIVPCTAFWKDGHTEKQRFFPNQFIASRGNSKDPLYHQLLNGEYMQRRGAVTAVGVPWGKLYNHSLLQQNNLQFNPRLIGLEDNILNLQAFHYAQEIIYFNYFGYHYRASGLNKRAQTRMREGAYRAALDDCERLLREYHLLDSIEFEKAWNDEQINIYFQEYIARIPLESINLRKALAVHQESTNSLRTRLKHVDKRLLSPRYRVKYHILTTRPIGTLFAIVQWASRRIHK